MTIEINKSDKEVIDIRKLWTGLCNMKVISINPSLEEAKALGLPVNKEPEYLSEGFNPDSPDVKWNKLMLNIYVSGNPKILSKLTIWLEDRVRFNKDGTKEMWINVYGATCWTPVGVSPNENSTTKEWFKMDGARRAKVSEDVLHQFIAAWANVATDGKCQLSTMEEIVKGNITEIKQLVPMLKEQEVKLLLGVKDQKWQVVYDKYFGRAYDKTTNRWVNALESIYTKFDADYQDDLTLRLYEARVSTPDNMNTNQVNNQNANSGGQPLIF